MTFERKPISELKTECFSGVVQAVGDAYREIDRLTDEHMRLAVTASTGMDQLRSEVARLSSVIDAQNSRHDEIVIERDRLKAELHRERQDCVMRGIERDDARAELSRMTDVANARFAVMCAREREIERLLELVGQQPFDAPVFERGRDYRNRSGEVRTNLQPYSFAPYAWTDSKGRTYTARGKYDHGSLKEDQFDLVPGAVEPLPTWVPPKSLRNGKYTWDGDKVSDGRHCIVGSRHMLSDYTDPPCVGIWEVTEPGVAVFRGEK